LKYSAYIPCTIKADSNSEFGIIGWHMPNKIDKSGKYVLYKKTNKGVYSGYILPEPVSKDEIVVDSNSEINQPWHDPQTVVYKHSTIEKVFTKILNKNIDGMQKTTPYMKIIQGLYDQGIPVFIVGGAIRDVVCYCDKI
jgi:hypothetical protein